MKADFRKWLEENRENEVENLLLDIYKDDINQFAEDYAEKEAIEFLEWFEGTPTDENNDLWDDSPDGYITKVNALKAYKKFKDDES